MKINIKFGIHTKLNMANLNMAGNLHIDYPLLNIPELVKFMKETNERLPSLHRSQVYQHVTIFKFSLSMFLQKVLK